MEKKCFRVMSTQEVENIKKEKELKTVKEEQVIQKLFENENYVVMYIPKTKRLQASFQDKVPYRIPLYQILVKDSGVLAVGIDAIPEIGALQVYGKYVSKTTENIIRPNINRYFTEENYKDSGLYTILFDVFNATGLDDKGEMIKSIIMSFKDIANELAMLSFNLLSNKVDFSIISDMTEERDLDLIKYVSDNKRGYPGRKELFANICTSKNITYPLYRNTAIQSRTRYKGYNSKINWTALPVDIINEDTSISLVREEKYDVISRELLFVQKTNEKVVTESTIPSGVYPVYVMSLKDRLALEMLKKLPTAYVELALALKRLIGEDATLQLGEDNKGVAITHKNLTLVMRLMKTKDGAEFYDVDYSVGGAFKNFYVDRKDLKITLENILKDYLKKDLILQHELGLVHSFIEMYISISEDKYDFWYDFYKVNKNYSLDEYNEDAEMDQGDVVRDNLYEEIQHALKYSALGSGDDLLYSLNINNAGELYVIINKTFTAKGKTDYFDRAARKERDKHKIIYHGSFISFKVCLEDNTIIFSPIMNKPGEIYDGDVYSLIPINNDSDLKALVENISEGIFMELIQKYVDMLKELDCTEVFDITR